MHSSLEELHLYRLTELKGGLYKQRLFRDQWQIILGLSTQDQATTPAQHALDKKALRV